MSASKCKACTKYNCKSCLKNDKISPGEEAVLQEMGEIIKKISLLDGTTQFVIKYIKNSPLENSFYSSTSNYLYSLKQAIYDYRKILSKPGGKQAVDEMIQKGVKEGHFRLLDRAGLNRY